MGVTFLNVLVFETSTSLGKWKKKQKWVKM